MHISTDRELLLKRLELVGKVSTKHVTLPVLQCVLLIVEGDSLKIKATNLEIGIEASVSAVVKKEGQVAVPAQTLIQTIQYINQKEITLRMEDSVLVIEGVGSKTNIKTISFEEFPSIPRIEVKGQVVGRELFSLGIRTVANSASQSSIKPELGSIYLFQKKEHTLTFVATDSFRLMEKTVPQNNLIFTESILIPQKNALEMARVCESEDSDPEIKINDNQCALVFPSGVYITSRLTTGSFPDYEQIIPKEFSTHTTIIKSDLVQTFKKTNIFLNKFLQVEIKVEKNTLTVSAQSGEVGTTIETVPAQTEGSDIALNFNQRYLSEPLPFIPDDSITLHFAGIGRPLVLHGLHDSSLRYLVMPMNK